MPNKTFVQPKQSPDGTVIGFWALIAIDNGNNTYSLFIKDQTNSGAPGVAAAISSSGASPVVASSGTGSVNGSGTTGRALKWLNGPLSVVGDADLAAIVTALGFTPENVANKTTDGTLAANSDTLYPSEKAVKTYVDGLTTGTPDKLAKFTGTGNTVGDSGISDDGITVAIGAFTTNINSNALNVTASQTIMNCGNGGIVQMGDVASIVNATTILLDDGAQTIQLNAANGVAVSNNLTAPTFNGYVPEDVANKTTDGTLAANSDTLYPSEKAVKTYANTKQAALGFTPENVANKTTDGTLAANSDTLYPSEKAVKTYVDGHVGSALVGTLVQPLTGYEHGSVAVGGFGLTANVVGGIRIFIPYQISVAKLVAEIVSPTAANFFALAVYSTAGNRLVDTGPISAASAGIKSVAPTPVTPVVLAPGEYFFCLTNSIATITYRVVTVLGTVNAILNDTTVSVFTAANPSVAGQMPATLGALTANSLMNLPVCKLQA